MIFVPTCGRPEALARCLASLGDRPDVVVVDDGGDAEAVARAHGARYVGGAERARLVEGSSPTVRRALLPEGPRTTTRVGAVRNVIALLARGRPYVSIDDDVEARFFAPTRARLPKPAHDPEPLELMAVEEVAPSAGELAPPECLGRSVRETFDPHAPARARVAVAAFGLQGDVGIGRAAQLAFASGATRAALGALGPRMRRGEPVVRMARCVQPSVAPVFVAAAFAMDGSLVPPFAPEGRNQDGLFAWTLRLVDPGACFVHLPLAVAHAEGRRRLADDDGAFEPRFTDVLRWVLLETQRPKEASPADAMRSIGAQIELADLSAAALRRRWDVERRRDPGVRVVEDPPLERLEGLDVAEAIRSYGRLLREWPDVVARCT